jgi:hypothetical protein
MAGGMHGCWRQPAKQPVQPAAEKRSLPLHRLRFLGDTVRAISIEVVTLIFFSHSASSEAQIRDTVSDEAQKLRLRP